MQIMKLNKPAVIMTDVDGCFVSNINGNHNPAILSLLEVNKDMISNCAVITGRDMSGLSRLLGSSEFKNSTSDNWKENALGRVEEKIKKAYNGEIVVCITNDLTEGEAGYKNHPGNYYLSYKPIEEDVMKEDDAKKALEKLNSVYLRNISKIEDDGLRGHARKIEKYDDKFLNELPLKGFDSYNKGAQVKFYLESLGDVAANSVKIYIDDVPSNVRAVAEKNSDVIAVLNDVEMGRGYNEQALNLAISFANGNETSYEKLNKGLNDYEVFSNHFGTLKDLGIIDKKTSIGDFVRPLVKNEDWFKAVEEFSGFLNGMITEYRAQEAVGIPKEARKDFLKENYNEFIKSAPASLSSKLVPQRDLSSDEELNLAIALSLGGVGSQDVKKEMKEMKLQEESDAGVAKNLGNQEIGSRAVMKEQMQTKERQALDEAIARSLDDEEKVAGSRDVKQRKSQIESDGEFARQLAGQLANEDFSAIRGASANLGARRPSSVAQSPVASAMIERGVGGR
jgi:hypothetical protein